MSAVANITAMPAVSILDALNDPQLMGESFAGDSREAWLAVLSAAFGLPLEGERRNLFHKLAGSRTAPSKRVRELWVAAGRRSGKTQVAAAVCVYLACIGAQLDGTLSRLSAGETGVVQLLAVDRHQAQVALDYIGGLLDESPILSSMVSKRTADGMLLTNGVVIQVATNSHRAVRGRTLLGVVLDECAFYRSEQSATPDKEVYRALVPSLATTGGMLIGVSSPYAKSGLLFDKFRKHHGQGGDVLVVRGGTLDFNPTVDPKIIEEAEADDPESARSEWHGLFRDDIRGFIGRDTIEAVTRPAPLVLPFDRKNKYFAFADPAGGGADEFTLAIGHLQGDTTIVDVLLAQRGIPAAIVAEFAATLREYCVGDVVADRYAGSWPADEFARHGIRVTTADRPKSDLYKDSLAVLRSGRCELPPDPKLLTQFVGLERRTRRGGKDSIDHQPNGHDDRANAVAGLLAAKSNRSTYTLDNV